MNLPPPPAAELRLERILLAHVRQQFGAPAHAIVEYAAMLSEDALRLGLGRFVPDLERIASAGAALEELVARQIDPGSHPAADREGADAEGEASGGGFAGFSARLRHDLRTPLNAIKGYGEMLAEDAEDAGQRDFVKDLRRLLRAADAFLAQIDDLVRFSGPDGVASLCSAADPDGGSGNLIRGIVEGIPLARDAARPAGSGSRILVVDDNPSNRELLQRRLTREGHRVTLADGGEAALDLVARQSFDVILLDLMMPGLSGFEVLVRLKSDPRWRAIPVVMISALGEVDSIARCIEAGAEDYLQKPFNPVLLRARLSACLERKALRDREQAALSELQAEKERSDLLLLNILPQLIVSRLREGERAIADRFTTATILFSDLVGFSAISASMPAAELVELLNSLFSRFDRLAVELGVEKIKTIGDAYMVAGGVPAARPDHADAVAGMGLAMLDALDAFNRERGQSLRMRIGMHTGTIAAGVIGTHKFAYDVWGETVNIAARMESHGVPGCIQMSETSHACLSPAYDCDFRGRIEVKGLGTMGTYLLRRPRPGTRPRRAAAVPVAPSPAHGEGVP